ncbi:MAG: translation initiation factor Sui1 [Gemmatimonadota bacterium]
MSKGRSGGLVYSTQHGQMCPRCRRSATECRCARAEAPVPDDGIVRIRLDTKGRRGKGVTTISGVPLPATELSALGSKLKRLCGSGGTTKDGVIEIQGDHRERLARELAGSGWKIKTI